MKERGMTFSAEEVRAILDGRKTQTRRLIDPQPREIFNNGLWYPDRYNHSDNWCFWGKRGTEAHNKCGLPEFTSPWQVGDRIWVKERWCKELDERNPESPGRYLYEADGEEVFLDDGDGSPALNKDGSLRSPWIPCHTMPRVASRILLEITAIGVQRIQEISEDDAIAEGIRVDEIGHVIRENDDVNWGCAYHEFGELWIETHGKKSWERNDWVWCLTFKTLEVKGRVE
jgi:hypothetical protein